MEKNKDYYRELIREEREKLDIHHKKLMDGAIFKKIISSDVYKISENIFIYVSLSKEADTLKLIEYSLACGKSIFVPKVISKKDGMIALKIESLNDLKRGTHGIMEPEFVNQKLYPSKIDLNVVPGVAFDKTGNRVGYGGGYYDRFLEKTCNKDNIIAIAYDFQVFSEIPRDFFDIKVNVIVTESQYINI